MARKESKYKQGDDLLTMRLSWNVQTFGSGSQDKYVEKKLGISKRTYLNRQKNPEEWSLQYLRTVIETCNLSNEEILQIMGRETSNKDIKILFKDLIKELMVEE